jgi:saccharopine dehydrogenase (NAD+, L-lysine-forming)
MRIGILRESKKPHDERAPLSPEQCKSLVNKYSNLKIIVQPSDIRCFKDEEYLDEGLAVKEDLSDCDVLMGVKEVNTDELIPDKTYMFFSHTIKKQEQNKNLLKTILRKNIRLIDYEVLTDDNGLRVAGFGHFAGLVGAYNGLRAYVLRLGKTAPKPAYLCKDLCEMKNEIRNFKVPGIKIAVTGGGRVANGVMELLNVAGVKKVSVDDFLNKSGYNIPVYAQLEPEHYVKRKDGLIFSLQHFFDNPDQYESNFERFFTHTDMLISAAYWDPRAPLLFNLKQVKKRNFSIKVIADITCDINGSIPTTKRASTIENPFYDYNRVTGELREPFSNKENITVMAVDNLPCELPRDASVDFGKMFSEKVIPALLGDDPLEMIKKATITLNGYLTDNFKYLEDWVNK